MKTKFMFVIALSVGQLVLANTNWQEVSIVPHTANTPREISDMLSSHADLFKPELTLTAAQVSAGLPVDTIVKTTITERTMFWTGPTQCVSGDPRLTVTLTDTNALKASGHGSGSTTGLAEKDPCSN